MTLLLGKLCRILCNIVVVFNYQEEHYLEEQGNKKLKVLLWVARM